MPMSLIPSGILTGIVPSPFKGKKGSEQPLRLEVTGKGDRFSFSKKQKALSLSPAHSQTDFIGQLKNVVRQLEDAHPKSRAELKFDLSLLKTAKFGDYLTRMQHYHESDEFRMEFKTRKGWVRNRYFIKMDGTARKMTPVLEILIRDLENYRA